MGTLNRRVNEVFIVATRVQPQTDSKGFTDEKEIWIEPCKKSKLRKKRKLLYDGILLGRYVVKFSTIA